jgi:hypothetical protein
MKEDVPMMRCRKSRRVPLLVALLTGVGFLGPPTGTARADLQVTLHETGAPTSSDLVLSGGMLLADGSHQITFTGSFNDFLFDSLTIVTSSPGTGPRGAMLNDIEFALRNYASGSKTLNITVSSDGFTAPGSPGSGMFLTSTLASSYISPGGQVTFQSSLDSTSTSTLLVTPNMIPLQNGQLTTTTVAIRGGASYTLGNTMSITLDPSGAAQAVGTTTTSVVPAPPGVVLALTGLPVLALGLGLRRHRWQKKPQGDEGGAGRKHP